VTTSPTGPAAPRTPAPGTPTRGDELRRLLEEIGYSRREAASAAAGIQAMAGLGTAVDQMARVTKAGGRKLAEGYRAVRDGIKSAVRSVSQSVSRWWSESRGKSALRASSIMDAWQTRNYDPSMRRLVHDNGISKQQLLAMKSQLVQAVLSEDPARSAWHVQSAMAIANDVRGQAGLPPLGTDNSPWVERPDGSFVARDHAQPDPTWMFGPNAPAAEAVGRHAGGGGGRHAAPEVDQRHWAPANGPQQGQQPLQR
jgi:hypothetical protein